MNIQGLQPSTPPLGAPHAGISTPNATADVSATQAGRPDSTRIADAITTLGTTAADLKRAGLALHEATRTREAIQDALNELRPRTLQGVADAAKQQLTVDAHRVEQHKRSVATLLSSIRQAQAEVLGVDDRIRDVVEEGDRRAKQLQDAHQPGIHKILTGGQLKRMHDHAAATMMAMVCGVTAVLLGRPAAGDTQADSTTLTRTLATMFSKSQTPHDILATQTLLRNDRVMAQSGTKHGVTNAHVKIDLAMMTLDCLFAWGTGANDASNRIPTRLREPLANCQDALLGCIAASSVLGLEVHRDGPAVDVTQERQSDAELSARRSMVQELSVVAKLPNTGRALLTASIETRGASLSQALLRAFVESLTATIAKTSAVGALGVDVTRILEGVRDDLDSVLECPPGRQGAWGDRIALAFQSEGPLRAVVSEALSQSSRLASKSKQPLKEASLRLDTTMQQTQSRVALQSNSLRLAAAAAQASIEQLSRKLENTQSKLEDALAVRRRARDEYDKAQAVATQAEKSISELEGQLGAALSTERKARLGYDQRSGIQRDPARSALRDVMTDFGLRRVLEHHLDVSDEHMRGLAAEKGANARYFDTETLLSAVEEVAKAMLLDVTVDRPIVDKAFVHADSIGSGYRLRADGTLLDCDANTSCVSIEVPHDGPPRIAHLFPRLAGQRP